jgi:hypothetical protein
MNPRGGSREVLERVGTDSGHLESGKRDFAKKAVLALRVFDLCMRHPRQLITTSNSWVKDRIGEQDSCGWSWNVEMMMV